MHSPSAVFLDPSGRRWRRLRRLVLGAGATLSVLLAVVAAGVVMPPLLPSIAWSAGKGAQKLAGSFKDERRFRARTAARRRLYAVLDPRRRPRRASGPAFPAIVPAALAAEDSAAPRITAGFFVNWDDNSLASATRHATALDVIVAEWGFVAPHGDSLYFRVKPQLFDSLAHVPRAQRPKIFLMLTNVDTSSKSHGFDPGRVTQLLRDPRRRARAINQLVTAVTRYGLGGITLDLEEIPLADRPALNSFANDLRRRLAPEGAITSSTASVDDAVDELRAQAQVNDYLFVMLYDEHYGRGDAGPVASQQWYEQRAAKVLSAVPREKAIFAIGAYGYEWTDVVPEQPGQGRTFQDAMIAAREHPDAVRFDRQSLNPYLAWTDPDSVDHVFWYLDGATAYNQWRIAGALGVAGSAVWRLGSEDPSLWPAIDARRSAEAAHALATIPGGYDVEFLGSGELLSVASRPHPGERQVQLDPRTHFVVGDSVTATASSWVIQRQGYSPHRVALTFDDGPDGRWTPQILDTLRAYHAPATFFVIGTSVAQHIPLLRRIVREGHEIGNHTYSHPDLSRTPLFLSRIEMTLNERLIEAITDRRTRFFRPPYFGDAEPTTSDELIPASTANDLGYLITGLHIDSEDWQNPGVSQVVSNVIRGREARPDANIVLLHDSGGDRAQTVAALGQVIDSLRARGDTIVPLSTLAGLTRAQAMPPLPPRSALARAAELSVFTGLGLLLLSVRWLFVIAVVIGLARLAFIAVLALWQRIRPARHPHDPAFAPAVSVIVPAYREERVINRTIASLLASRYAGDLEIVVVDDGSPDQTYAVAMAAFGEDPRVSIHHKPNGGKASALNYGIERARGGIVIGLDADTLFAPDTIAELVAPMADPEVGAVAGNAKVGNRVNIVTRWQALEYVTSQNLDRRAFDAINAITVVPGAVGAWRRDLVLAAGGFSEDTLAEDQDLTIAIRRMGHRIAYAADAVAYTEAPDTFRGLAKQRFRWSFGTLQCAWKHRGALLRPRFGSLGFVALPNTWLFQLAFTAIAALADLAFAWSLLSVWLVYREHGPTYARLDLIHVLTYYGLFLMVDWIASAIAFAMESREDFHLTWLIPLQRFAYRQILYYVVLRSFVAALRGGMVGWGKLERKATVELPPEPAPT